MVGTKSKKAEPSDDKSGNTACMVFFSKPVVGKYGGKHGGKHKVQALEIKGKIRSDESTHSGTISTIRKACKGWKLPKSILPNKNSALPA